MREEHRNRFSPLKIRTKSSHSPQFSGNDSDSEVFRPHFLVMETIQRFFASIAISRQFLGIQKWIFGPTVGGHLLPTICWGFLPHLRWPGRNGLKKSVVIENWITQKQFWVESIATVVMEWVRVVERYGRPGLLCPTTYCCQAVYLVEGIEDDMVS